MSDLKVVILLGSPRRKGEPHLLSEAFAEGARRGRRGRAALPRRLPRAPHRPGGDVWEEREDVRADDDARMLLGKMAGADIVVFASPVYWQGVSAQLKCLIDRQSAYYVAPWLRGAMAGKGFFVITPGARPRGPARTGDRAGQKCWARGYKARYLGEIAVNAARWGEVAEMPGCSTRPVRRGRRGGSGDVLTRRSGFQPDFTRRLGFQPDSPIEGWQVVGVRASRAHRCAVRCPLRSGGGNDNDARAGLLEPGNQPRGRLSFGATQLHDGSAVAITEPRHATARRVVAWMDRGARVGLEARPTRLRTTKGANRWSSAGSIAPLSRSGAGSWARSWGWRCRCSAPLRSWRARLSRWPR